MDTVAIIQARMGSTRLPGKVLKDLNGGTMLQRVIARTRRAATLAEVVVATSTDPTDDVVVEECGRAGIRCFRGSESDVLDRYYRTALVLGSRVFVRITSDCPLIDPSVIDRTVHAFYGSGADYASNILQRTYPRGLDTEVFTLEGLERCWREAKDEYQRIHVTPYFYQHPEIFRLHSVTGSQDFSRYRWTVDTPEDMQFVQAIYSRLGPGDEFSWERVLDLLQREPQLSAMNESVSQKALHEG